MQNPGEDQASSARRGAGFPRGGTMREPCCPLSSAVCNATIPLFEMAESACSPFCYVLHSLSFVYKVYICFLSRMRDWTVAVAQYSIFACFSTVYLKLWLQNNLDMFIHLTMIFN